jgi:hypothetical protein
VQRLVDIVLVEGPTLSHRLFRLYAQAANVQLRKRVVSTLSGALKQAVVEGCLVAEDDRVIDGKLQQILRTPEQPPVILRRGGNRSPDEIPLTEFAAAIIYVKGQTKSKMRYFDPALPYLD